MEAGLEGSRAAVPHPGGAFTKFWPLLELLGKPLLSEYKNSVPTEGINCSPALFIFVERDPDPATAKPKPSSQPPPGNEMWGSSQKLDKRVPGLGSWFTHPGASLVKGCPSQRPLLFPLLPLPPPPFPSPSSSLPLPRPVPSCGKAVCPFVRGPNVSEKEVFFSYFGTVD